MSSNFGSLNLIAPAALDVGVGSLTVANEALNDVARRGFVFPSLPQQPYHGVLPTNVVHLTDEQLGDVLNQIASWLTYAQTQLAIARAARNESEAKMEFIKSRIRLGIKAQAEKKTSNPEMDDIVLTDQRFLDAHRNYLYCEAVFDYTKQLVDAAQRDWETVSRRITQRGQEVERMIRGNTVGSVPVMSSNFGRR